MTSGAQNRTFAWTGLSLVVGVGLGYALAKITGGSAGVTPPGSRVEESAAAPTTLSIPDEFLTTMDIGLEPVAQGDLGAEILAPATVSAATNGQAVVTAHAAGTVVRLDKRLGDPVAAGEVLALVESREATTMTAERATAESRVELARSVVRREQSLYDQKVTPRQGLEAAQADLAAAEAEAARARTTAQAAGLTGDGRALALKSPIAGRITAAKAQLGAYVEPDAELFRVADPRFVLIEASTRAADARRVSAGDRAKITTAAGVDLAATVVSVTPTLDERTRSATVTLSLEPGQPAPAPGEFVQARIATHAGTATAFVVPDDAVQSIGGRNVVFVRSGQEFRAVTVMVATRSGGRASIVSGLHAGDVIATRNAFLLKAELSKGAEEDD